jgi:transposase
MVALSIVREFKYVYATISPQNGSLCYMIEDKMNTETMSLFLRTVSRTYWKKFVIMVVDGASPHRSKDLFIPNNISLIFLPPYSPELNPAERVWNVLRRDYFANRYFETLDLAIKQADNGMKQIKSEKKALKSLTYWPWIHEILIAT